MRHIPNPARYGRTLLQRAKESADIEETRAWLFKLVDAMTYYKMRPEDIGVEKGELDAMLTDFGMPTFDGWTTIVEEIDRFFS